MRILDIMSDVPLQVSLSWEEAVGECSLYAGWLVALNSLQEQNCLLKHAQAEGLTEDWYWTDGTDQHSILQEQGRMPVRC